ncbi:hypothetical protein [Streptomyces sp. NPDC058751]|uniref:hypothetical protein n=1 Tax=Streptomyces sp. NPDC058751 TaxID=3346623 RepID=UPI0036805EE3
MVSGTSFPFDGQGTATASHAMKRYRGLSGEQEMEGMSPTRWLAAKELMKDDEEKVFEDGISRFCPKHQDPEAGRQGHLSAVVPGRVSSRDHRVVLVRSLIQIIEACRWRPARQLSGVLSYRVSHRPGSGLLVRHALGRVRHVEPT